MKLVDRIGRPFVGSISRSPFLLRRKNVPVSDIVDRCGSVPLRTLPYSQVSETYVSGRLCGSDSTRPCAFVRFACTSHDRVRDCTGVPRTVSSSPSLRVDAPFRLKRM